MKGAATRDAGVIEIEQLRYVRLGTRDLAAAIDDALRDFDVRVTELPDWSPAGAELPVYLEGGQYHYDDGRWVLDLNVSSARGQGESVTWAELPPAWRWVDVDPALTWAGVSGAAGGLVL